MTRLVTCNGFCFAKNFLCGSALVDTFGYTSFYVTLPTAQSRIALLRLIPPHLPVTKIK